MKLDYDAQLASTKNYEISGEDKFCKKPISDPRKSGEVWVDDEGILPFSSATCTLGAYADFKAKGKKINVTYVFDTTRGIKLFADQAFYRGRRRRYRAVPAEEGRRSLRRQEQRQGARIRGGGEVGRQRRQDMSSPALVPDIRRNAKHPRCWPNRPPPWRRRASPAAIGVIAARWFRLNKDRSARSLIGALSLVAFLIVWHLLTKYRVVFFVRFTNVPSPLAVYDSFTKAIHDPKFLMHVAAELPPNSVRLLAGSTCRGPARPGHGPFQADSRSDLPGFRSAASDPRDRLGADGDHALADQRAEHRLHHFSRLVLSDPGQYAARHVAGRSGSGAGGAMPRRPGNLDLPRSLFSGLAASHFHRAYGRNGRRLGFADRGRDDLRPIRHRLFHLGSLFAGPIRRHRARHDRDRRARP